MIGKWWRISGIAVMFALAVAFLPRTINTFLMNGAWLQYTHVLFDMRGSLHPGIYSQYGLADSTSPACHAAQTWAENALHIYDSVHTRLALGRMALCSGENQTAFDWVKPIAKNVLTRAQDYSLVTYILSRTGSPEQAIDYYTRIPSAYRLADQNDAVALAYLTRSKTFIELGSLHDAEIALQQVLQYRPFDIYANFQMRHLFSTRQEDASAFIDALRHFPLGAVLPENAGLVPYITETIPGLVADGIWDHSTLGMVLSALVWRYPESREVEKLLYDIRNQLPNSDVLDIDYDLGDLYERRGALGDAAAAYALSAELGHLSSVRRLTEICQVQPNACSLPVERLRSRLEVLISQRWASVSDACQSEREYWLHCTLLDGEYERGDAPVVSAGDLSDDASKHVKLGPNLFQNSSFEIWNDRQNPAEWLLRDMHYGPGKGAFAGGRDSVNGIGSRDSVRLVGFWGVEPYSSVGLSPWEGSDMRRTALLPGGQYVLTVNYMTDEDYDVRLALWSVGLPLCHPSGESSDSDEVVLPNTRGLWIRVDLDLCTTARSNTLSGPAIRLWSLGNVWVNSVYLRERIIAE